MVHIGIAYMVHKKSCEQSQTTVITTLYQNNLILPFWFGDIPLQVATLHLSYNVFRGITQKMSRILGPIRVITRHITNNSNHGFVTIDQIFYPIQRTKNASTIKKTMFNLHCTFMHTHTHTTKVTYSSTTLSFSIGYPN